MNSSLITSLNILLRTLGYDRWGQHNYCKSKNADNERTGTHDGENLTARDFAESFVSTAVNPSME